VNQRDAERGGSTGNQDMQVPSEGKNDPPSTKEMPKEMPLSEGKEHLL
jgi:hypothetical protein